MSNLMVCRICLAVDVRLFTIANTHLQEIYEKMTNISFNVADKPILACYICHSQLLKCRAFIIKAMKADELLTHLMSSGIELTQKSVTMIDRQLYNLTELFTTSSSHNIPPEVPDIPQDDVKDDGVKSGVEVKEEVKDANNGGCSDFDNNYSSDSEDDIPLKKISLKHRAEKKIRKNARVRKKGFAIDAREIILNKEQQLEEVRQRAKSLNYINSPFKCELCYKGFIDCKAFQNHKDKHDERSGPHECEICRMRYRSLRHLRTHVATSHTRYYQCNKCSHRSHTTNQAREHDKWHSGHTYRCQLCGQQFRKHTSYLTHLRKCHPTEYVCDICGESFVSKHGLLMHKSKIHKLQKVEESDQPASERFCVECNIQFQTSYAWKKHIITSVKHTLGADNNICRICGEQVDMDHRDRHMREHQNTLKAWRVCVPRSKLAYLSCDQCGSRFSSRSKLLAHVRRIHLGLKYNKNIVCEVCGKKCTSNASLKYHQRTHTGEKPYSCSTCPKRFSDKNQLRIHTRTHTGEKPYCCSLCAKTFSQKPALNRHYRVHTGAKPYECQYCTKTFSQSNSVKLHVRTVHLKMPHANRKSKQVDEKGTEDVTLQTL